MMTPIILNKQECDMLISMLQELTRNQYMSTKVQKIFNRLINELRPSINSIKYEELVEVYIATRYMVERYRMHKDTRVALKELSQKLHNYLQFYIQATPNNLEKFTGKKENIVVRFVKKLLRKGA